MPLVDYSFVEQATILRLECRVADGWRRARKTYCFSEEVRIPWRHDYTLKTRTSMFPYPVTLSDFESQWRPLGNFSGTHENIKFRFKDGGLRFDIPLWTPGSGLNEHLPWDLTQTKKYCVRWEHVVNCGSCLRRISLLIVFDPPPAGPPPDVRDWFRRFYPGGLPSLGKKR